MAKVGRPSPLARLEADAQDSHRDIELDPENAAIYIAEMAMGLRLLARRTGLGFLAYLLDMAATEAVNRGGKR